MEYNLYCDESCYLEHDDSNAMTIGAVIVPKEKRTEICSRIIEIKKKYDISPTNEIKWSKARNKLLPLYLDLVDYFFDDDDISFRVVLIPEKQLLNHEKWKQSHNTWYYKMYFEMLKVIFNPDNSYNVYIDIKDTHSNFRVKQLQDVCNNNIYDFNKNIVRKIQTIRSDEVQIMQLTDILIGAVCRSGRKLSIEHENEAKLKIIERIKKRSGYQLNKTTLYREQKFNLLVWEASI
ncbi:hypothetical protein KIM372_01020 [Bombiscardovia nodaiensis]|uniref:DUF3800 domain-containing protein n=1 Tax=Bombiscardovia nodaiensis TaxID=2932181 RepID=A0ABM8B5S4_9BIFI|nr:hypothetical protein KIM372_01020 [Bombiscardovia nodaiensis]